MNAAMALFCTVNHSMQIQYVTVLGILRDNCGDNMTLLYDHTVVASQIAALTRCRNCNFVSEGRPFCLSSIMFCMYVNNYKQIVSHVHIIGVHMKQALTLS